MGVVGKEEGEPLDKLTGETEPGREEDVEGDEVGERERHGKWSDREEEHVCGSSVGDNGDGG
ncbi:hypothetical protein FACS189472_12800 [Alphaproteobacteria bacterium]|nr:hypothetical protein FACS189472_12800 [Alphaproteobacteria bacterium]